MTHTEVVTTTSVEPLAREWDELANRTDASPFLRPGFLQAWWSCFGEGPWEVLTVRRDGRLVGLAPLQRRRGVLSSLTNWETPEFGFLIEDESVAVQLMEALLGECKGSVVLSFLRADDPNLRRYEGVAASRGYRTIVKPLMRSPYVSIDRSWEAFESDLDSRFVRELRRRLRRLEERGSVLLEVSESSETVSALLEEGLALEAAGWKGSQGTAINAHPSTRRFYTDVARWAAERGWLRLAFLRLSHRAVAFDLSLEDGSRHYLLKTAYDPAFRELAPGMLMRHAMLARAFGTGLSSYEFLGNTASWKRQWTSSERELVGVRSFGPSPAHTLQWWAYASARPFLGRVRTAARGLLSR